MSTVIFFHGLNTYDDDLFHIGPITLGRMHDAWEREFSARGLKFISVTGLRGGSPEAQAEHARTFFNERGLFKTENERYHFLGHSAGGLVARILASDSDYREHVDTVITMGTPHLGTEAALLGLDMEKKSPRLSALLRVFGYDVKARAEIFKHFTPEALDRFNAKHPSPPSAREITLLCEIKKSQLSLLLLPMFERLHSIDRATGERPLNDGFIRSTSQKRGEVLGPFAVDHLGQLGAFLQPLPRARRHAHAEFIRMVETVVEIVSN